MRKTVRATVLIPLLTFVQFALAQQPQKFLVVEPKVSAEWINQYGKDYSYIWQSANDGRNLKSWKTSAPETLLSSYFPYSRDPLNLGIAFWKLNHPDWIAYKCDGQSIAFQFGNQITPLDISNPEVAAWQLSKFRESWQKDIGFDNFQLVWCLKSNHQIMVLAARATDAKMVSALLCHTNGLGSSL